MELPGIPEGIENIRPTGDALGDALQLQLFLNKIEDERSRAELSRPVLTAINHSWELRNRDIELIGTIIGPDPTDLSKNIYHDYVHGRTPGFTYTRFMDGDSFRSLITIHVQKILTEGEATDHSLAGPLYRRLNYHAPVEQHPIFELAS